jgi:hypothetical protein
MKNLLTFAEYIKESDGGGGGGGVAFATPNASGMGNVVASTVGSTPGSVWGAGSGVIGSGDMPAYDYGKKFGLTINKEKPVKKNRRKKQKNTVRYFTKPF